MVTRSGESVLALVHVAHSCMRAALRPAHAPRYKGANHAAHVASHTRPQGWAVRTEPPPQPAQSSPHTKRRRK